jgi:mRNA interferase RelE/StbE
LAWNVELLDTAKRQLTKLDRKWQAAILDYLEDQIAPLDDPRSRGKPLVGDRKGLWRYRVGDYRILCELRDGELIVLVVTIGHRREVYPSRNDAGHHP